MYTNAEYQFKSLNSKSINSSFTNTDIIPLNIKQGHLTFKQSQIQIYCFFDVI